MDSHSAYTLSRTTPFSHACLRRCGISIVFFWALLLTSCSGRVTPTASPLPATATSVASTATQLVARPTPVPTIGVVDSAPSPTYTRFTGLERRQLFHAIWKVVHDNYVYQDYNGVDWAAAEHSYDARIAAAPSTEAFYDIVREAIDSLADDHTRFDSPQDAASDEAVYTGTAGYAGIGVMLRDLSNGILIIRVARNGPAALAGVHVYDRITAIDGRPVADFEAKNEDYGSAIRGLMGTTVTLSVTRGRQTLEFPIVRNAISGDAFPEAVAMTIPGTTVQLLSIDSFNRENLRALVITALQDSTPQGSFPTGLIIDVRENGGGSVEAMTQIIGLFADGGILGEVVGRHDAEPITVEAGHVLPLYADIPIAVLISEGSVSAAEMFASGMHSLRNATLVGHTTAGNTENLYPYDFEDGSVLWLAEVLFRQNDGSYVDNIGVSPDITVPENPDAYDASNDPVIQAALQNLNH